MRSTFRIRCALLVLAAFAGAGCASFQSASGDHVAYDETVVEISNYNWATAAVYAVRGGTRSRIGTVETGQTALLRLPTNAPDGDVYLLVHLIGGGGDYVSPVLPALTEGRISLSVQNHLALSSLTVR